jgi:hypothetical protein
MSALVDNVRGEELVSSLFTEVSVATAAAIAALASLRTWAGKEKVPVVVR